LSRHGRREARGGWRPSAGARHPRCIANRAKPRAGTCDDCHRDLPSFRGLELKDSCYVPLRAACGGEVVVFPGAPAFGPDAVRIDARLELADGCSVDGRFTVPLAAGATLADRLAATFGSGPVRLQP
jgi:hypothetical protein